MSDALLFTLLEGAGRGFEAHRTRDRKAPSVREFQLVVQTAQRAVEEGLIEAYFQAPSRGKHTAGLIRGFDVVAITPAGLDRLSRLRESRQSAATATAIDRSERLAA